MLFQSPEASPNPSGMMGEFHVLLNFLLGFATVVLAFLTYRLSHRSKKLEEIKEYSKRLTEISYVYQDLILLGPRFSGKTSVARLWTEPWFDISRVRPSDEWTTYEASIFDIGTERFFDNVFDVERPRRNTLRIRIYDYPGEDHFRNVAIEKVPKLHNAVLLLFFEVVADSNNILPTNKNNEYFSKIFMDKIEDQGNISKNIAKVIIVFNKVDLLPSTLDFETSCKHLHKINADAIKRIHSLFSSRLDFAYVSAVDNRNLISLLGSAGSFGMSEELKQRFEEQIQRLSIKTE